MPIGWLLPPKRMPSFRLKETINYDDRVVSPDHPDGPVIEQAWDWLWRNSSAERKSTVELVVGQGRRILFVTPGSKECWPQKRAHSAWLSHKLFPSKCVHWRELKIDLLYHLRYRPPRRRAG
jgi:hypothetical protein